MVSADGAHLLILFNLVVGYGITAVVMYYVIIYRCRMIN